MGSILVGMADLNVARSPDTLVTLGLGSCVGLILYDADKKFGGMAHIMLPTRPAGTESKNKAKFADTAIEELRSRLFGMGASNKNLMAKMAGGAHMFSFSESSDILKVGLRNAEMCREILRDMRIPLVAEDTGGNCGRTIEFCCETFALKIRVASANAEKTI